MNIKYIFLLIYTIASTTNSSFAITSDELIDLEKNESQIELPPFSTVSITPTTSPPAKTNTDNTLNISELDEKNKSVDDKKSNENAITSSTSHLNVNEENEQTPDYIVKVEDVQIESENNDDNNVKNDDIDQKIHEKDDIAAQENLTIPVFSEWTQMQQMQEKEKKQVELTNSTETNKDSKNETLPKHQIVKLRQKNYASPDCGAKILQSNPEAQSSSSVLSDKDEYMLSPCTDRIWFVVELCDSIQAQRVELANFELFSSPLKSVSISVSNRFPAREWSLAGHFDAKSERDVQNFELKDVSLFGKFVRVDLQYTNTEHYCPLSFFRVFGTSEIEAFEVENEPDGSLTPTIVDDDFVHSQHQTENTQLKSTEINKDNILNRAGAAVMSIVQKAAEVLVKSNGNGAKNHTTVNSKQITENCMSMSHNILCESCSTDERDDLYNFIGCKNVALSNLLDDHKTEIKHYLINSLMCHDILGFDLMKNSEFYGNLKRNFLISILPQKYINAMCNMIAKDLKVLTVRIENIPEISSNLIPKKDEVSLKNVSKKEEDCNHSTEAPIEIPTTILNEISSDNSSVNTTNDLNSKEEESNSDENTIIKNSSEINIFNKVDRYERILETEVVIEKPQINVQESSESSTERIVPKESTSSETPKPVIEVNQPVEVKINGDSSRPESVFLRLSNRIKILEKNMTLSTQYLEELSRRYKKQIEDLQTSYSKLQAQFDGLSQHKKDNEKKFEDERHSMKNMLNELDNRSQYMEKILIVLSAFLLLQTIFVIVLFKRMSILHTAVISQSTSEKENKEIYENGDLHSVVEQKTKNGGRKRSKQRVRKISAPNILSQRGMKNDLMPTKQEISLNRTSSAPNKVSEIIEIKENNFLSSVHQSTMLEENDDILIPGFEDLRINGDENDHDISEKKEYDDDEEDTASTASIKTADSQKSFNIRRRLSSPTFLKKIKKNGKNRANNDETWRKAKSESPPKINNSFSSENESTTNFKTRKNNSFKKLFKKLF